MQRATPLETGETYHVYNRGAHKMDIFRDDKSRRRFQALLLVCNRKEPAHLSNLLAKYQGPSSIKIFSEEAVPLDERLVDIFGYCLMPNHFHLILRQNVDRGITTFMRKVGTAYSMYFNLKYDHSGTLLQGRFKSQHVSSDSYFRWLFQYVHLNPLSIIEPDWKESSLKDEKRALAFLDTYAWSSYFDYARRGRPERKIVTMSDAYENIGFANMLQSVREHKTYQGPSLIK